MPAEPSTDIQRHSSREFAPFLFIVGLSVWTVSSFQIGRVWERVWNSVEHLQPLARLCESGMQLSDTTPHLVISQPDDTGSQPLAVTYPQLSGLVSPVFFVINLRRRTDRRMAFARRWAEAGFRFQPWLWSLDNVSQNGLGRVRSHQCLPHRRRHE